MNGDTPQQNEPDHDPEIIVDTDWKEQVAKEKAKSSAPRSLEDDETVSEGAMGEATGADMPPAAEASFEFLVSMLFAQAMNFLGQVPDPTSQQTTVNKPYAKLHIDLLELLEKKTDGNRTEAESTMLGEALHVLRMAYVNAQSS